MIHGLNGWHPLLQVLLSKHILNRLNKYFVKISDISLIRMHQKPKEAQELVCRSDVYITLKKNDVSFLISLGASSISCLFQGVRLLGSFKACFCAILMGRGEMRL